ncbi:putative membrane protein [Rhodopirellula maiorica SM1]|uniref:Putative membrane protein n=1 Tax=Rhodopirellula maiorica SM1 TaxID=1265738 RepID=M5RIY5_9BACT|nr:putative membrane protein [Rhodopirellula maiorica SM1]
MWVTAAVIFVIACGLRLPASQESYWVDELHTAWTVSDSFAMVTTRSAYGHQQPFYFQWLWGGKQLVGSSEIAMRLSSVLAVSLACSCVFVAVAKFHRSLVGGIAAGLVLAAESNSIFFGTELRPYAAVILASAIACGFVSRLWSMSPADGRRSLSWVGLGATIGAAGLCQITSLGVLGWLVIAVLVRWGCADWRATVRLSKWDLPLLVVMAMVALSLFASGGLEVWNERKMWASFASATSLTQVLYIWPWTYLLVVPLLIWLASFLWQRVRGVQRSRQSVSLMLALAAIAFVSALCFWGMAYFEFAALWHRRYLVASLPLLAWFFGAAISEASNAFWGGRKAMVQLIASGSLVLLLLGLLMQSQGTSERLIRGEWLTHRGENWRDAIAHVNDVASDDAIVFLDPGLIEQSMLREPHQRFEHGEYLRYVVDGPYAIRDDLKVEVVSNQPLEAISAMEHNVVLSRRSARRLRKQFGAAFDIRSFGGVSVAIAHP